MWSWGAPAMLGWLAAAIIPWLLWWRYRPRRVELPFAAILFLERGLKTTGNRRTWLTWMILALQIAAVVLLALGWGEGQWLWQREELDERLCHLLVIDATASMQGFDAKQQVSHFDQALLRAKQIAQQAKQQDSFALFLVGEDCQTIVSASAANRSALFAALERVQGSNAVGDFTSLASPVRAQISTLLEAPWVDRLCIYLISDFQKTSWPEQTAEALAQLDREATPLPHEWKLVDVGPPVFDNLGVTSLSADFPTVGLHQPVTLQGKIRNYSRQQRPAQVQWWVDGQMEQEQRIDVEAGNEQTVFFKHPLATSADHLFELRLGNDDLTLDNRNGLIVDAREKIRILAIGGKGDETHPARLAWQSVRVGPTPLIEVTDRLRFPAPNQSLADYSLILLANVASLSQAERDRLASYVQQGGTVVILLGDNSRITDWNEIPWLPGELSPPITSQALMLDSETFDENWFVAFRGTLGGGLFSVPIWRHVPLQPRDGSEVLLQFTDGSAAVLLNQTQGGNVVLWSFPWNLREDVSLPSGEHVPWSAICQSPSFVPVVHELLKQSVRCGNGPLEVQVGQPLSGYGVGPVEAMHSTIVRPDGRTDQLPVSLQGTRAHWSYQQTELLGLYRIQKTESEQSQLRYVRFPTVESEPSRQSVESWLPTGRVTKETNERPWSSWLANVPWYRYFLGVALGCLLLESGCAWFAGRKSL